MGAVGAVAVVAVVGAGLPQQLPLPLLLPLCLSLLPQQWHRLSSLCQRPSLTPAECLTLTSPPWVVA